MRNKEFILVISSVLLTFGLIFGNGYIALAQYENMGSPPTGQDQGYQGIGPPPGMPSGAPEGYNNMMPQNGQNGGPSEEQIQAMQKKGEEQQLKGRKQMVKGMESGVKRIESQFTSLGKKGMTIGEAIKQKLQTLKTNIETIKNAQSTDEIESIDRDKMQEDMQSLGEYVGNYQKMQGLKKMLASMERGIVSFEKRMLQLEKQGVTIPTDIKDDFNALKAGMAEIKNATSPEELEAADPDTLGDLMTKVNESRPRLEMITKWPRILKQADQQIKQFKNQLAKTKILVDKLKAKDIDVTADYTTFETDVNNLKTARDTADALMKEGKSEEAFSQMEDEFFNKLDDVGEHQRVIQMMSNLSRFNVEFKRSMASAQGQIKSLTKRKIDTSEIQSIYDQALAKGNEIAALIKVKPIDEEAILSAMDTMESLKQDFQNKFEELSGGQTMPWETKSPSQFQDFSLPKGFESNIPTIK